MIKGVDLRLPDEIAVEYGKRCESIAARGQFIGGMYTDRLEAYCSQMFFGTAVAMSSATDATIAVLRALEETRGDKPYRLVIPVWSFPSTLVAAVKEAGPSNIDLLDVDVDNLRIDADLSMYGPNDVLMLSHAAGAMLGVEQFEDFPGIVVEDFSHSWGSAYNGRRAGTLGHISLCSMLATKTVHGGTGAIVIDHTKQYDEIIRSSRVYGREAQWGGAILKRWGGSWRMSEMEAALATLLIERVADVHLAIRREHLQTFAAASPAAQVWPDLPVSPNGYRAIVRTSDPAGFAEYLRGRGIECPGRIFEQPVHGSPVFDEVPGFRQVSCPKMDRWCSTHSSVPCHPMLSKSAVEEIKLALTELPEELHYAPSEN